MRILCETGSEGCPAWNWLCRLTPETQATLWDTRGRVLLSLSSAQGIPSCAAGRLQHFMPLDAVAHGWRPCCRYDVWPNWEQPAMDIPGRKLQAIFLNCWCLLLSRKPQHGLLSLGHPRYQARGVGLTKFCHRQLQVRQFPIKPLDIFATRL